MAFPSQGGVLMAMLLGILFACSFSGTISLTLLAAPCHSSI